MAVGQTYAIQPGTAIQYFIPSGFSAPSIGVLNPNDGIAYVSRNRQASNSSVGGWDYKVPSQSYAVLPGLYWQSVGVFYLDQSGANTLGEITIYPLENKTVVPVFQAIGRAVQVAGTTVDISQGNQPQNPPANTGRLWVDNSGNLNLLLANGTNRTEVDSVNVGTYVQPLINATALGGDLTGTIPNGHVRTVTIDGSGNITLASNLTLPGSISAGPIGCGAITCGAVTANGDIHTTRGGSGNQSGVIYFGSGSYYLYFDGTSYNLPNAGLNVGIGGSGFGIQVNGYFNGGTTAAGTLNINTLNVGGPLTVNGTGSFTGTLQVSGGNQIQWNNGTSYSFESGYLYFRNGSGFVYQSTGGSYSVPILCGPISSQSGHFTIDQGNAGYAYCMRDTNVRIQRAVSANYMQLYSYDSAWQFYDASGNQRYQLQCASQCDHYGNNGSTNHRFFHHDTSWMGTQAANFQVQSSVDHARIYNKEISPIDDAVGKVLALNPVYYYHMDGLNAQTQEPFSDDGHYTYGFSARDVAAVLPELVDTDAGMIDYNRMMAVLWQSVKDIVASLPPGWRPLGA
jgi:hypothetical protein